MHMPTTTFSPTEITPLRRKRFVRGEPVRFQITLRDIEMVRLVADHRFLNTMHLTELTQSSHKKLCDRLFCLFHAGYLDRPRAQLEAYRDGGGSRPMVYGLGMRGARLLIEQGLAIDAVDWRRKNLEVGQRFIEHSLEIADVRVALAKAIQTRPGYELLDAAFLLNRAPEETKRRERPWTLRTRVHHNGNEVPVSVEPDHVFAIGTPDRHFRAYLVEVDRGTMPVARAHLNQTSFKRKILAYAQARRSLLHQRQFGWKTFRVLVVTSTKERADTILKTIRASVPEHERFLFLVADRVSLASADIIGYPWRDATGATHGLIT